MENLKNTLSGAKYINIREATRYSFGDIKECKKIFQEAFILVDKTITEYKHLPEYDKVVEWLSDTQGKGLFLIGNCGRGKSIIINGVVPLIFLHYTRKMLKPIPARNLHNFKDYNSQYILIDDIGTEEIINNYGTKIDAVEEAVFDAEDNLKLLILTSNLDANDIKSRYGERIYDRIKRLCKVVFFKGESFRK